MVYFRRLAIGGMGFFGSVKKTKMGSLPVDFYARGPFASDFMVPSPFVATGIC